MDYSRIRITECLAVNCPLALEEFRAAMQRQFRLPDFEFDSENENEWGLVDCQGIQYNVSRPYERGKLEEWDGSVPVDCNFGVLLIVSEECPPDQDENWSSNELAPRIGQGLADTFGRRVYHYRSSVKGGKNVTRKIVFNPNRRQS
jgi:hypothetical protein